MTGITVEREMIFADTLLKKRIEVEIRDTMEKPEYTFFMELIEKVKEFKVIPL